MSYVHLIRHGEPRSGWGEPDGEADPGLTDLGRRQAKGAAARLAALAGAMRPTRVLTSPLRRCRETAAPLAALLNCEARLAPAVAEIPTPPGVAGGDRATWLRTAMAGDWAQVEGIDGVAWSGAVVEAVLAAEGAAVFTHFVAINAAVGAAKGSSAVLSFRPAPGSITTLRIEGGRLRIKRLGEALEEAGRVL